MIEYKPKCQCGGKIISEWVVEEAYTPRVKFIAGDPKLNFDPYALPNPPSEKTNICLECGDTFDDEDLIEIAKEKHTDV